jgi:hypothetical protein
MTAFFIPGLADDLQAAERAYTVMRTEIEHEMGRRPNARRIVRLWTRRGSIDCITEVGSSDPLLGGTVMAIFDMGTRQPYVVCWQTDGEHEGGREVLPSSAYSVSEFES